MSIVPTTLDPAKTGAYSALSSGNLVVQNIEHEDIWSMSQSVYVTPTDDQNKYYWEVMLIQRNEYVEMYCGVCISTTSVNTDMSGDIGVWARSERHKNHANTMTIGIDDVTVGDTTCFALDLSAKYIWFGINGTWESGVNFSTLANPTYTDVPAAGVSVAAFAGTYQDVTDNAYTSQAVNFGQAPFNYSVPSGYIAGFGAPIPDPSREIYSNRKLNFINPFPILGGV